MRGKQTLVINGKVYDAVTGLPVAAPDAVATPSTTTKRVVATTTGAPVSHGSNASRVAHHAKHAHRTTKKSATLRREYVAQPVAKAQVGNARRRPATTSIAQSDMIQKFAPHPQPLQTSTARLKTAQPRLDITPVKTKPAAIIAQKHALVTAPTVSRPAAPALNTRSVREQLIAERLASVDVNQTQKAPKKSRSFFTNQPRRMSLVTGTLAAVILAGYFTYINMPGLSVRVAAAQADVAASFPDYRPDGYRFSGPVAFAQGQVAIDFKANGGTTKYTVAQQKSTWDSQAVYDNVVAKAADDSYVTNSQQGLTIYTFKGQAAWVNKGILYTVTGDAPLSNEQLLRIAGSL